MAELPDKDPGGITRRSTLRKTAARAKLTALARIPIPGPFPRLNDEHQLKQRGFNSFPEYEHWARDNADLLETWRQEDQDADGARDVFDVPGYCVVCDRDVAFMANVQKPGPRWINWREQLVCPGCRMYNRIRAALHLGIQDFGLIPTTSLYTTEQLGVVYRWLCGHFNSVIGSEYLSPGMVSGSSRMGINHQDVENLVLPHLVDCILSFDVLEHVPHPIAAFESFARSLSPGGRLIMTVPFTIEKYDTTVRAMLKDDGEIEHYLPVEIHGNPLDPESGSLCYRHFGWDVLDQLRESGFAEAAVHVYHSRQLGYLGGPQRLISAVKS